jgi:hypothetical protein
VYAAALAQVIVFAPTVPSFGATSITLAVEKFGALPGFHSSQLRRYLAVHMPEARLADWRFEPAAGDPRNFACPRADDTTLGARRPITIELRLYRGGEYQTLVSGRAVNQGGPDDLELAAAVANLTKDLPGASGAYRSVGSGKR